MKRLLSTLLIVLAIGAFAPPAFADSAALVRYLPKETRVIAGLEVASMKDSFVFTEALTMMRGEAKANTIIGFVLNSEAIGFEKNVTSMVAAFERPMVSLGGTPPPGAVILQGTLDEAKIFADARKAFPKLEFVTRGTTKVLAGSGMELGFLNSNTLVISDKGKFADTIWAAVGDKNVSALSNSHTTGLRKLVDTSRGLWVTMDTRGVKPSAEAEAAAKQAMKQASKEKGEEAPKLDKPPEVDGIALSLSLVEGLALDFKTKFKSGSEAEKARKELQGLRDKQGNEKMVEMVGAKPLVDNLKLEVINSRILSLTTKMTTDELLKMLKRVESLAKDPPKLDKPGEKGENAADGAAPPTGQGADADFN